jgi:hypothetical protein
MAEEGEAVPPQQPRQDARPSGAPRPDGGAGRRKNRGGRGRSGGGGGRPGQGGPQGNRAGNPNGNRFRSAARSSRQQQWDPRKEKAYSEPRDYVQPQAQQRPVQITHKPKRTLVGFVGSLLGRKKDDEEKS